MGLTRHDAAVAEAGVTVRPVELRPPTVRHLRSLTLQTARASIAITEDHRSGKRNPAGQRRPRRRTPAATSASRCSTRAMKRHQFQPDALIEVLHTAQELFGFLADGPAALRRPRPEAAAQPGLRRRHVLPLLLPQAAGRAHLRRLHGHGLLRQGGGRACSAPSSERLGVKAGETTRRRQAVAADGPLPRGVRHRPGGGLRRPGRRAARRRRRRPERTERMARRWTSTELPSDRREGARGAEGRPDPLLHGGGLPLVRVEGRQRRRWKQAVAEAGLGDRVQVAGVGCLRLCGEGPLVQVDPDGAALRAGHAGRRRRRSSPPLDGRGAGRRGGATRTARSSRARWPIVLREQRPDRARADRVVHRGRRLPGPATMSLREMSPAEVVEEITRSGLRGRGGAGYPTGVKWGMVAKQPAGRKFVVCNGDEGDPGAFMDRSVLESDPHRVLEGHGHRRLRGRREPGLHLRPRRVSRWRSAACETAIKQAKRLGLLGSQHLRVAVRLPASTSASAPGPSSAARRRR